MVATPIYADQLIALVKYQPPINQLIFDFKYHGVKDIAQVLASMIYYCAHLPEFDLITFVPLHPKKEKLRGFNQAQLIAQQLSIHTQKPCHPTLLKIKNQPAQASIANKNLRVLNADNLYQIGSDKLISQFRGKTCLLIDDVSTTGATINQCAKILKENGMQKVYGLTFAHG